MNHRIARLRLSAPCGTVCFASLPLLFILPVSSYAQSELRADKQILLEAKHGTVVLRKGPDDKLYVLTRSGKPPSSLWISEYSGSSMRQILSGGSEHPDLLVPRDFAVDRNGNAIVVDGGLIKIFSTDGKMLSSFPADRPESVGVLSDGARRNFIPKAAQIIEVGTVDFNGGLWHLYAFSVVSLHFMLLRFAAQM